MPMRLQQLYDELLEEFGLTDLPLILGKLQKLCDEDLERYDEMNKEVC